MNDKSKDVSKGPRSRRATVRATAARSRRAGSAAMAAVPNVKTMGARTPNVQNPRRLRAISTASDTAAGSPTKAATDLDFP